MLNHRSKTINFEIKTFRAMIKSLIHTDFKIIGIYGETKCFARKMGDMLIH